MFQLKFSNSLQNQVKKRGETKSSSSEPGKLLNFSSRFSTHTDTQSEMESHAHTHGSHGIPSSLFLFWLLL